MTFRSSLGIGNLLNSDPRDSEYALRQNLENEAFIMQRILHGCVKAQNSLRARYESMQVVLA